MRTIKQKTVIRGLHVYKRQVKPGDILSCKLDQFWMLENPSRYSIAVKDSFNRTVSMSLHFLNSPYFRHFFNQIPRFFISCSLTLILVPFFH